jgi:hypothetical protein
MHGAENLPIVVDDVCLTGGVLRRTRARQRLAFVVWLFAVAITWCVVRSSYLEWGSQGISELLIPLWVRGAFFAAFVMPTIVMLLGRDNLFWLLGLSASIGTIPQLPFLPFIHEYAHVAIVLGVVSLIAFGDFKEWKSKRLSSQLYIGYIAVCLLSTIVNWLIFRNLWQLKVGVAFLILFGCFALFIFAASDATKWRDVTFSEMLDGLVWGIFGQGIIGLATFPLLLWFQEHEGNDTVFGLAFYERYKSTFPGPVNLGMFLIVSMPLVLLWMHRHAVRSLITLAYLQFLPWLVIISGSRTARGVGIFVMLSMILRKETRLRGLAILPSAAVASYLGFFYNSFPAAIRAILGDQASATLSFKGRFFDLSDRTGLVDQTMEAWMSGSGAGWVWHSLLGFGAGVGGYAQSGYPSPHMMVLNLVVEAGILGLTLYVSFAVCLLVLLLGRSLRDPSNSLTPWMCFIVLCATLIANATYVPHLWGFYMITIIFSCAALDRPVASGSSADGWVGRALALERGMVRSVFGANQR